MQSTAKKHITDEGRETGRSSLINGVDTASLSETMAAIERTPSLASFQFRAENHWLGAGHNRTTIKEFYGAGKEDDERTQPFVLYNDEPPVLLGRDCGANPVENLLHALAGCLTTSLVYHAAARGITVHAVESRFEGDLDLRGFLGMSPEVRNGYENIRVTFKVNADASDAQIAELVELAQKRSPVFDVITHGVPVDVRAEAAR